MTNPNYAHITMIVDRSGSMAAIRDASQEGVNGFIAANQEAPGRCTMTLIEFDDKIGIVGAAFTLIDDVAPYYLHPRGSTALYDAIAFGIKDTGDRLKAMKEKDRPGKVLVVVQTDGWENASRTDLRTVSQMIAEQRDTYSWEFVFLGANLDAAKVAQHLNIVNYTQYQPTAASAGSTYDVLAANTVAYRGGAGGMSMPVNVDADGSVG